MSEEGEKDAEALPAGTQVRVLGRGIGEIVSGPNQRGLYRVRYGIAHMELSREKFSVLAREKRESKRGKKKSSQFLPPPAPGESFRIDLHGLTIDEAERELIAALDRALREHVEEFSVVHGIGSGALRSLVDRFFGSVPHLVRFGRDPRNHGVTVVKL